MSKKRRRVIAKFSYDDIALYLEISPLSLRQLVSRNKLNLRTLSDLDKLLDYFRAKHRFHDKPNGD